MHKVGKAKSEVPAVARWVEVRLSRRVRFDMKWRIWLQEGKAVTNKDRKYWIAQNGIVLARRAGWISSPVMGKVMGSSPRGGHVVLVLLAG